jgi:hypothetical protein
MEKSNASPFGPFYPASLQQLVNHAERLSAALVRASELPRASAPAEVWLTGRTGELEAFVGDVLDDWRRGVVSADDAAGALQRYLGNVHRGMVQHVTNGARPACCTNEHERPTVKATPSESLRITAVEPPREATPTPT